MSSQSSDNKSWRITALLFLIVAAIAPAAVVSWIDAKQHQHRADPADPNAPNHTNPAPDWYRAGAPRAPWEGTPRPLPPAASPARSATDRGSERSVPGTPSSPDPESSAGD
ncbi:MAG: hypothetical protein KF768_11640 [Phycisphaeraceae bacterium]|nr:hypothetical protein [Phycisphaeraceae bacterium]